MLISALAVLLLLPDPAVSQSVPDLPPVLRAGDVVQVQVWRQPEFSGEFEVTGEGTVSHPLYRQIRVAEREVADVEDVLRTFLRAYVEEPSFVVEGFFRIAVGGEVRQPDVYTLRPETSIARAVALAGGATQRGDLENVMLRRGGQAYPVDLTDPSARLRELQVRSGDEIVVERRRDLFREYIAPSASVVSAIAILLRLFI